MIECNGFVINWFMLVSAILTLCFTGICIYFVGELRGANKEKHFSDKEYWKLATHYNDSMLEIKKEMENLKSKRK